MSGTVRDTSRDNAGSDRAAVEREATVLPFRRPPVDAAEMGDLLSRFLRDSDAADADGPHVVIARGAIDRYFGPFATRYHALAAAAAEDAEWQREFPGAQVTFDIAPLASTNCLAEF